MQGKYLGAYNMAIREINNRNFQTVLPKISTGDHISLKPGNYRKPLVIDGKMGTEQHPIFLGPSTEATGSDVVFSSDISLKAAREWANRVADKRQQAGYYPSFGHLGDQALLVLRNCQYLVVHGLNFLNCWPGAIYLDNCQNIVIHDVHFKGGTIAIGANGTETHDIVVQHCVWKQDPTGTAMWDTVPWGRIHGASDNSLKPGVDLDDDYRHWDGDFFRGWDVGGNITIRSNTISDAFNGIHFFNSTDRLPPGVVANRLTFNSGRRSTANILIENNDFTRIRDNVFEPEDHAWNWVIRYNRLRDCYRPFSFEFERAGWIYIYGNTGSFVLPPSTDMSDEDKERFPPDERRGTTSLFKPKGNQLNKGPIIVCFNSWYFKKGKGILPKYALGKLKHVNNAIQFGRPHKARMFGQDGEKPTARPYSLAKELASENKRFTRRWGEYQIEMNGDVSNDDLFPEQYRSLGYNIGLAATNADPQFVDPFGTSGTAPDFTSGAVSTQNSSIAFEIELPDGYAKIIEGGYNRGAAQLSETYETIDKIFGFLPEDEWLPALPAPRVIEGFYS